MTEYETNRDKGNRKPLVFAVCFLVAISTSLYGAILYLNSWHFTFALDDAYIHLALAENIMQGHYGININEASAPASSILWPFIIAPIARLGYAEHLIFFANTVFACLTLVLFWKIFLPDSADVSAEVEAENHSVLSAMLILLVPACNLIGLIFCGMEHSLQVMLSVAIIYGLIYESKTSQAHWWLSCAIIMAPLIRYECLAISLPAIGYLYARSHKKAAILSSLGLSTALIGFSFFLIHLGQSPFPSSIAAKSTIINDHTFAAVIDNFIQNIDSSTGILLVISMLLFVTQALYRKTAVSTRLLAAVAAIAVFLHLLFGKFGWYSRYEIYIWAMSVACLGSLVKHYVFRKNYLRPLEIVFVMFAATIFLCFRYLIIIPSIPLAANNIYEQHYQMHRFIVEFYKKPVAANDIGYVSYRNSTHVLDLWGLASKKALELRLNQMHNNDWMATLVKANSIDLVMIYEGWFHNIPSSWNKLGELKLGKTKISADVDKVAFFSTRQSKTPELIVLLIKFANTLPDGARFIFHDNIP